MSSSSPPPATVIHMPASQAKADPTRSPSIVTAPQTPKVVADDDSMATMPPPAAAAAGTVTDKVMSSAANLAQLLPTGTVLAYQSLSPAFTNHGACLPSNRWLTAALVAALAALSLLLSFTDSVVGRDGKLYYGVATPRGFDVFNFSGEEEEREWALGELARLRLRPLDYVHAFFAAVVFLTVAFSDVGLQRCFFPDAGANAHALLTNLPLGMSFLSSFVFIIFPTKRKGIGYNDATPQHKV
ncbi:hypothetical protein ACP4OV_015082 [Aristida adscensionis]